MTDRQRVELLQQQIRELQAAMAKRPLSDLCLDLVVPHGALVRERNRILDRMIEADRQ